jgi:hypothetical protein
LSSERLNNEEIEMSDEPPTEETAEMLLPPTDEFRISTRDGDLISDRDFPPPHEDHDCGDPFIPRRLRRRRDEHR